MRDFHNYMRDFHNSLSFLYPHICICKHVYKLIPLFIHNLNLLIMVRIRNLLFFLTLLCCQNNLLAQIIRKDHREMTPSEKRTYRDAAIARRAVIETEASHHQTHFQTEIHTFGTSVNGRQFLPWHRLFILDTEDLLKTSGVANADKITVPYWDWRVENNTSNITWDDSGFLDLTTLNNNSFNITRGSMTSGFLLASNPDLNSMMDLTDNLPSSFQSVS